MAESGSPKFNKRPTRLHLDRNYLTITGISALLLLCVSLMSVDRERRMVQNFGVSNLQLGERLTVELERQAYDLSQACLADAELRHIAYAIDTASPDEIRDLYARLALVQKRHPIAGHIFIVSNGVVSFPRLKDPALPRRIHSLNGSPQYQRFEELFQRAVSLAQTRQAQALPMFMRCAGLDVQDEFKAMALLQAARCYAGMSKPTGAVRAYEQIELQYGDLYDDSYRPYAVIAAIERDKMTKAAEPSRKSLAEVYCQLMRGRWQMSESALLSLRSSIEGSLGPLTPTHCGTQFSGQFEIARAVQKMWVLPASPVAQPILFRPVKSGGGRVPKLFCVHDGGEGPADSARFYRRSGLDVA